MPGVPSPCLPSLERGQLAQNSCTPAAARKCGVCVASMQGAIHTMYVQPGITPAHLCHTLHCNVSYNTPACMPSWPSRFRQHTPRFRHTRAGTTPPPSSSQCKVQPCLHDQALPLQAA
eukprot:1157269-Pelagomonas_calceolata.AAC.1